MTFHRLLMPFDQWPSTDRMAWERRFNYIDVFDEISPTAVWGAKDKFSIGSGYGRWLGFLRAGGTLDEDAMPCERVTRERVAEYIENLETRVTPETVYNYVRNLRRAIEALTPNRDWRWLCETERQLSRRIPRLRDRGRLVPIDELYALGFHLMAQGERTTERRPLDGAVLYRDGLLIALLAARPLRRSNMAALRIGQHVIETKGRWTLRIPAHETKSRRVFEALLPDDLNHPMSHFLEVYRPRFKHARRHDNLWPSRRGGPLGSEGMYHAIIDRTKTAFGFSINPNRFRACAVTSIAKADPVHIRTATELLGHAYISTTERHYNLAQTIDASRRYQRCLDAARERLGGGS